jgi:hypothetical protein
VNGRDRPPPEPILRDIRTIENRDALIDYDDKVLERDEGGEPVTIWDGLSFKKHRITGKLVPDETGRLEVYRYLNPRLANWPKADFIIGNPPFIGNKRMRDRLGDGYTNAVRAAFPKISESVDFVMYWWAVAATKVLEGTTKRFGLITTDSITQVFNRSAIEAAKCKLAFAIPDHPWVDGTDGADVRIAMTVADQRADTCLQQVVSAEGLIQEGYGERWVELTSRRQARINSDLSIGTDMEGAKPLRSNHNLAVQGMNPLGLGFRLLPADLQRLQIDRDKLPPNLKPYLIGRDLVQRHESKWVVDFHGLSERDAASASPILYQHILHTVKPERDHNRRATRRDKWWLFGENAPTLRRALVGIDRAIATCRTAKHRIFTFVTSNNVLDAKIVGFGLCDAYHIGVLSSRPHTTWAVHTGAWLGVGNDSNYNHSDCFGKFPFPAEVPEPLKERIRAEAEALDALRKRVLAEHEDLTLTKLYNLLEALRESRPLSAQERDIHDRGLVSLICQHHDTIDALVAEAYGWPADLPDEEIIARLVVLNKERAAEEAKGLIRWLRPEYQAPDYQGPVDQRSTSAKLRRRCPTTSFRGPDRCPSRCARCSRCWPQHRRRSARRTSPAPSRANGRAASGRCSTR